MVMTFLPEFIPQILNRTKVETRRLVKDDEHIGLEIGGVIHEVMRFPDKEDSEPRLKWRVGQVHQVCVSSALSNFTRI